MSQIDAPIPQRAYELVRDRIALIIAQELYTQSTLLYDDNLLADVYLERTSTLAHTECPAVNVCLSDGDYLGETVDTQDGLYMFHIDVYTKAKASGTGINNRGDRAAGVKLHRLIGVINAILMHKKYLTLGFTRPFISNRRVAAIKMTNPINNEDNTSTVWGRLEFTVRVPENQLDILPNNLDGLDTTLKLDESEQGYIWTHTN